jgi:hypothetical protein
VPWGLAAAAVAVLAGTASAAPADPAVEALLARAREAIGIGSLDTLGAVRLTGTSRIAGMDATFEMVLDSKGRFIQKYEGPITISYGFDGVTAWTHDLAGEERELDLADRAQVITSARAMTGWWLHPSAPSEFAAVPGSPNSLVWKWNDELAESTVTFDATTGRPVSWSSTRGGMERTTTLAGEFRVGGFVLPATASTDETGGEIVLTSAEPFAVTDATFRPSIGRPADVRFDGAIPAELQLTRAKTGHLLVKTSINGQDAGYFIFDTGAGGTVVSKELVEKLGLKTFGSVPMIGIGGKIDSSFVRPETFSVGPVTITSLVMTTLDTAFLSKVMGYEINGIVGYGVMHRSIVEYDNTGEHAALHEPATFSRPGLVWEDLRIASRVPAARATFAGKDGVEHSGWFRLDTGASQQTLTFHYPAVRSFALLEGRETKESHLGGVGGAVKSRTGPLGFFTLGGWKREDISAEFATEDKGAFADPYSLGNIGGKLLDGFVIFFDYQGRRIAFVRK